MSTLSRTLVAVCIAAVLCAPARPSRVASAAPEAPAADGQSQLPTLKPSHILDAVRRRKSLGPRLSPAALARYANELLALRGFDYNFDACEIFPPEDPAQHERGPRPGGAWARTTLEHRMTRADESGLTFRLVTDERGGMCAECFLTIPALRVTKGSITVVAEGGATYELKRPAAFKLDEAQLLDPGMKRALRTWQLPYQTIPAGVSPDGKSVYLSFYEEAGLDELVLEISEEGSPRFTARAKAAAAKGEWVTDPPREPDDPFEGYMRFSVGRKGHVIRFSGPCT